jgi:RecJ-like exonuclease
MSDLVNRLLAHAGAMRGRANRNPDIQGQLNQIAALLTEAANALQADVWRDVTCERCKGKGTIGDDWCGDCGGAAVWRECRYCTNEAPMASAPGEGEGR